MIKKPIPKPRLSVPQFLYKAYEIVENPETQDICCWSKNGDSFIIKNVNQFCEKVLLNYFKTNNFASFVRQLNMYGFHKIRNEQSQTEFQHKQFKRGQKHLLIEIKRKSVNENPHQLSATSACSQESGNLIQTTSQTSLSNLQEDNINGKQEYQNRLDQQQQHQQQQFKHLTSNNNNQINQSQKLNNEIENYQQQQQQIFQQLQQNGNQQQQQQQHQQNQQQQYNGFQNYNPMNSHHSQSQQKVEQTISQFINQSNHSQLQQQSGQGQDVKYIQQKQSEQQMEIEKLKTMNFTQMKEIDIFKTKMLDLEKAMSALIQQHEQLINENRLVWDELRRNKERDEKRTQKIVYSLMYFFQHAQNSQTKSNFIYGASPPYLPKSSNTSPVTIEHDSFYKSRTDIDLQNTSFNAVQNEKLKEKIQQQKQQNQQQQQKSQQHSINSSVDQVQRENTVTAAGKDGSQQQQQQESGQRDNQKNQDDDGEKETAVNKSSDTPQFITKQENKEDWSTVRHIEKADGEKIPVCHLKVKKKRQEDTKLNCALSQMMKSILSNNDDAQMDSFIKSSYMVPPKYDFDQTVQSLLQKRPNQMNMGSQQMYNMQDPTKKICSTNPKSERVEENIFQVPQTPGHAFGQSGIFGQPNLQSPSMISPIYDGGQYNPSFFNYIFSGGNSPAPYYNGTPNLSPIIGRGDDNEKFQMLSNMNNNNNNNNSNKNN